MVGSAVNDLRKRIMPFIILSKRSANEYAIMVILHSIPAVKYLYTYYLVHIHDVNANKPA